MVNTRLQRVILFCFLCFIPLEVAAEGSLSVLRVTSANSSRFVRTAGGTVCYYRKQSTRSIVGRFYKARAKMLRLNGRRSGRVFVPMRSLFKKVRQQKREHLSRKAFRAMVAAQRQMYLDAASACRSVDQVGGARAAGIYNGTVTLGLPATQIGYRLRWFPSDSATGYYGYITRSDGSLIRKEELRFSGCAHRLVTGFTSGICVANIEAAGLPSGFQVSMSAYNSYGESVVVKF